MNESKKIMSERFYKLDDSLSLAKLIQAQNEQIPVYGKVILWNSQEKLFKVNLGNGFLADLPLELSSVYNTNLNHGRLSSALHSIIGTTISAIVLCVNTSEGTPKITLSRKETMLEGFDIISKSIGKTIECCVTSIASFGVFVDSGNGISGLIHFKNLCIPRIKNFSEIVSVNSKITAEVLSVNPDKFHVDLNYKDQFENLSYVLNREDLIEATILKMLNADGYFAYLNPNTAAVVDVPRHIKCEYGDKVVARVKGPRTNYPRDLRLTFVSFVL